MTRLIERLNRAIEQAHIPREVPFLRAERALLWVRMGELERARAELVTLRLHPETATNSALNAWIWLVDGMSDYFQDINTRARDKVLKALALSQSTKAPRVQALTAAWCAHLDFRQQKYDACIQHLSQSLRCAPLDHASSRARSAVVIAGALQFCGREDLARPWYGAARTYANREGDGVTLSSIMYNMAACQVIDVRLTDIFGEADPAAARRAMIATESSVFLDQSVQAGALSAHSAMQRAMVLVAHARYTEALQMYETSMGQALVEGLGSAECLFQVDRAWCLLRLGRHDEALDSARAGESALLWGTESEERAVAHGMLSRVFEPLGLGDVARQHAQHASTEWGAHLRRCASLLQAFQDAKLEALEPMVPAPRG